LSTVIIVGTASETPLVLQNCMNQVLVPGYSNEQKKAILLQNLPDDIDITPLIDFMIQNDRMNSGLDGIERQIEVLRKHSTLANALGEEVSMDETMLREEVEQKKTILIKEQRKISDFKSSLI
jgi:hypothetical protein